MKIVGTVRHMDGLGRVVIPKDIRRRANLKEGDSLEIFVEGDIICIKKEYPEKDYLDILKGVVYNVENGGDFGGDKGREFAGKLNEAIKILRSLEVDDQGTDCPE